MADELEKGSPAPIGGAGALPPSALCSLDSDELALLATLGC